MSLRSSSLSSSLTCSGLVLTAIAPFLLLTGCSNMATTAMGTGSVGQAAVLSGHLHGGRQPVVDSTVTLWAAGNAGYGSAATQIGASTSTDANGDFAFTGLTGASCPSVSSPTASQYLYMVASGGQPSTGVTNSSAAFMVALGDCQTVIASSATVNINEVTTIASMFALQQFFAPDTSTGLGSFGTSATNLTGLKNAFATVGNLVNINTGAANGPTPVSGAVAGYTTAPTVTITPEQAKINTLANILANCVNSDGSASGTCPTLFTNVNATAAKDTLQAAYYLATNPTSGGASNISAIYTTASAESPFSPVLGAAPTDWTIGVTYGSSSSQTAGATPTPVYLMTKPENLAIDSQGNVWVDNYVSATVGAVGNSVAELSPVGVPLNHVLISTPSTTDGALLTGSFSIALDPSDNVFVTNYGKSGGLGTTIAEYTAGGSTNVFTTAAGPTTLAIDGGGNIFIATTSATGGGADLEVLAHSPSSSSATTQLQTGITDSSYSVMGIDSNESIWLTSASTSTKATAQFLCTAGTPVSCGPAASTTVGGQIDPEPLVIDSGNNVWVGNYNSSAGGISKIAANSTGSSFSGSGLFTGATSGLNYMQKITIDGNGNIWTTGTQSTAGSVAELNSSGTVISPTATTGFAHTYSTPDGIAIDGSGNVWIGNGGSSAAASATIQGFITEIVGAAAPVITPISAGLPATFPGTSKLGTRPLASNTATRKDL